MGTALNRIFLPSSHKILLHFTGINTVSDSITYPLKHFDGLAKVMIKDILRNHCIAATRWQIALLRYFKSAGVHETGINGMPAKLANRAES